MAGGYIVGPGANFSNADLTGVDLSGADLSGADLTGVKSGNITGTPTLSSGYQMISGYIVGPSVDLTDARFFDADLSGAVLNGANLYRAALFNTDLSGADLSGANLTSANLTEGDLTGADLTGADLTNTNLLRVISGNITGTPTLPSAYQMINGYIAVSYTHLTLPTICSV